MAKCVTQKLDPDPDNPAHAVVCPQLTKSEARLLASSGGWADPPPDDIVPRIKVPSTQFYGHLVFGQLQISRYNPLMPGEFDLINWIRAAASSSADFVELGIGDDLAILRWPAGDLLLVGVDQVLDGVHFDSAVHGPREIGRKVMNRNLSDCAAMGCLPVAAVATVALPNNAGVEYGKQLYLGLREAGDVYQVAIVGGDTASWPGKLVMTVSIVGRGGGVRPITRAGA